MGELYSALKDVEKHEAAIDAHEEELVLNARQALQVIDSVTTLANILPHKYFERVPVPRIVAGSISWSTKLQIAAQKLLPGFIVGAVAGAVEVVRSVGPAQVEDLVVVASSGSIVAVLLALFKLVKEVWKDRKLEKEVRAPLHAAQGVEAAQYVKVVSLIFSTANMLCTLAGLNTQEALKQVSIHLRLLGKLPREVSEFLAITSQCLDDGSPGGTGLTADEIVQILDSVSSMQEAYKTIAAEWSKR